MSPVAPQHMRFLREQSRNQIDAIADAGQALVSLLQTHECSASSSASSSLECSLKRWKTLSPLVLEGHQTHPQATGCVGSLSSLPDQPYSRRTTHRQR